MQKIEKWLNQFQTSWKTHNIKNVLNLFSENVEYWETPFIQISNFNELKKEWTYINKQKNINIETEIFSAVNDRYSVKWFLTYQDEKNNKKILGGVYLIKLNANNQCDYFFHCGETKKS